MDQRITVENTEDLFVTDLEKVINALQEAGFEPFDQLIGYVLTGDALCITRHGNARAIVSGMDRIRIKEFLIRNGKWPKVLL